MKIQDISTPISPGETPIYPGDPGIEISSWAAIPRGDAANVSLLHFGAHTGTHVDAPAHFIEGAPGVASLPLEVLTGEAHVIEIPEGATAIEESHVQELLPAGTLRVLFKTRNSAFWRNAHGRFREDYTYIAPRAARALVTRGVRLVGIDYLSVDKFGSKDFATHITLLSSGVIILECLDLHAVAPGKYELLCLPLKVIAGSGDGAPARAVLRTFD